MRRRDALKGLLIALAPARALAGRGSVATLIGTGVAGSPSSRSTTRTAWPSGQFDGAGHLYIAERDNYVIRKVDAKTGVLSTFAGTGTPGFSGDGGPARMARLAGPKGLAWWRDTLSVADTENHVIREINLKTNVYAR